MIQIFICFYDQKRQRNGESLAFTQTTHTNDWGGERETDRDREREERGEGREEREREKRRISVLLTQNIRGCGSLINNVG